MKTNCPNGKARVLPWALGLLFFALGGATPPPHSYANGFSIALKIGESLYQALPTKLGDQLNPRPVSILGLEQPFIGPIALTDENKVWREVSISEGLIDLMNHVSHAKAVDRVEPGFFDRYVKNISINGGDHFNLPEIVEPRFWTDSVENYQMSYFNQMVGMLMAINLSHHYLGHYAKYADKLAGPDNLMLPINRFLSPAEWETSVKAGAVNSLMCALGTEGAQALFDAIARMPKRPAWVAYIVPQFVDIKDLNKELGDYEDGFYHGKLGDLSTQ
jgi:hypothetical protein